MPIEFTWAEALRDSPIFLVLVGCSVVTLSVLCERLWYFWTRRADPDGLLRQLLAEVRDGNLDRARRSCPENPHPFARIAERLLESNDPHEDSSEERVQIALSEQRLLFERNLGVIATMAAIAPLIGLLGTVWGIMRAFADMSRIGSASPSIVAAGVAEALITTAAGLIIAVPAVILYNHFTRRMNTALTVAENHARALRSEMRSSPAAPASSASAAHRTTPASAPRSSAEVRAAGAAP